MDETPEEVNYQYVLIPISLLDMLEKFQNNTRTFREAIRLEEADSVHNLFLTSFDLKTDTYIVRGECFSATTLDLVYEIQLKLGSDPSLWKLACPCPAGKGEQCKHVVAGLMAILRKRRLPYLTCTDKRQKWGAPLSKRYLELKPFVELCCVKNPCPLVATDYNADDQKRYFKLFVDAHPDSAVAKLKNMDRPTNIPQMPVAELIINADEVRRLINLNTNCERPNNDFFATKDIQAFFDIHVKLTAEEAIDIAIETSAQNTEQWRKNRGHRITASVCYGLYTYKLNKKADWTRKFENIRQNVSTPATIYGKKMESTAYQRYKETEPSVKKCGFVVNPNVCWLGSSPDGVLPDKRRILEIKCPKIFENQEIDLSKLSWIGRDEKNCSYFLKQKTAYYGQVQLNLYILNCDVADFVIYSKFSDRFEKLEVPYDRSFTGALVERLKLVYFENFIPFLLNLQNH